jgi:hypothetical protein
MSTKKQNAPVTTTNEILLTFYQADTMVETKFTLNEDFNTSLLIGTAINELFTLQNNYRNANIRLFKSNEPLLFKVACNEVELLNIGKASKVIHNKLKFNKTSKSMRSFAKRVNLAVIEITRGMKLISYEDLMIQVENANNSVE